MLAGSTPVSALFPASRRLWPAALAVCAAALVAIVASADYYLIEDASPLTPAAYATYPLLRFSFDTIYATALAAGIAALLVLTRAALARTESPGTVAPQLDLLALPLALLLALGGFGGLAIRQPGAFLFLAALLLATVAGLVLVARATARRLRAVGRPARDAAALGACIAALALLALNLIIAGLHTVALAATAPALYRQTLHALGPHAHLSELALGNAVTALALLGALALVVRAARHG